MPLDGNLAVADFEKMQNNQLAQLAFETLDCFRQEKKRVPEPWDKADLAQFIQKAEEIAKGDRYKESGIRPVEEWSTGDK